MHVVECSMESFADVATSTICPKNTVPLLIRMYNHCTLNLCYNLPTIKHHIYMTYNIAQLYLLLFNASLCLALFDSILNTG